MKDEDEDVDIFDNIHELFRRRRKKDMKARQMLGFFSGGASIPDPAQDLVTYYGDDLVYFLDPANLNTMFKENATNSTPVTHVSADADAIGLIYDRGYHGFFATAQSDATRPTLGSDATVNSFLTFNGIDQRLTVPNSQKYLKPFHQTASQAFGIMFWVKINAADGVQAIIMDSNNFTSTANNGITIVRFTNNRIGCFVNYSSGGNYKIAVSHPLVASDGWQPVIMYSSGNGTNTFHIQVGNQAETLGNVGAVGNAGDATSNIFFGCNTSNASFGSFSLGSFLILNRVPTAQEIADFKLFNPVRNTNNWIVNTTKYNFNNSARGWADTGKTVPITNGVAIRAWEPEDATIFGPLNRDLTTASAGVSPIWTTNLQNGKAGLVFDGTDDEIVIGSALFREVGGCGVLLSVFQNIRPELGSHLYTSGLGTPYHVITGSTYPSGAFGVGETYFVTHTSSGATAGALLKNKVEGVNVIVEKRNGSTWDSCSGAKVHASATAAGQFSPTRLGAESIAGWQLKGNLFKTEFYSGIKTTAQIDSMVDAENTSYNI